MNQTMEFANPLDEHARTIIHIDLDCFYAQVEMLQNPEYRTQPLGIQQKNIVVTSNYVAREFGIKKCMFVSEAMRLCPKLVLVNGEDLKRYRQISTKVTNLLQKYTLAVERLGLDENFIDATDIVMEYFKKNTIQNEAIGNVYKTNVSETREACYCGCQERLMMGTRIAQEIRDALHTELGLTSCAGISYNKLLAKLVCATHKPNQQSVVFPENTTDLLSSLDSVRGIPGIGQRTCEALASIGVMKIDEMNKYPIEKLRIALGTEVANKLHNLCRGCDPSVVKPFGKPQSIGLEDSCKNVSVENEVEEKFKQLLGRLMELVVEDGRVPTTLKVTIRIFDAVRKTSHREQKQCNVPPTLFTSGNVISLSEQSQAKILVIVMRLFNKLVDIKKPFHITLLGLSFTKFQERPSGRSTMASFLIKNVAVQAMTSFQNKGIEKNPVKNSNVASPSMDVGASSPRRYSWDFNTDGSESEVEPSPKKTKLEKLIARRRCFNRPHDSASPSKLRVAELRINSREFDKTQMPMDDCERPQLKCPPDVDATVFKELPADVQEEIVKDWMEKQSTQKAVQNKKYTSPNSILKYLIPNK